MKVVKINDTYRGKTIQFDSGNIILDNFIKEYAFEIDDPMTYLLLSDKNDVIGYYSITVNSLDFNCDGIVIKMGGSAHIDKFAVCTDFQDFILDTDIDGSNYHISDWLLDDCIDRIKSLQDSIGISYITLSSTKDGEHFYCRNGFVLLETDMSFTLGDKDNDCIEMYYQLDEEF